MKVIDNSNKSILFSETLIGRQGKIADPDQQDPNYKFLIKMLHVHYDNFHGLNVQ